MPETPPEAVFRFSSPGLTIEFEGPEDWVAAQIDFFGDRLRHALGTATDAGPTAPDEAHPRTPRQVASEGAAAPEGLVEFYEGARSREGRGAMQEKILIFAYFLQGVRGQDEVSIDEITSCFAAIGAKPPRSLANTLGIMKRTQGFFESASGRGRYRLTADGLAYVKRLAGVQ